MKNSRLGLLVRNSAPLLIALALGGLLAQAEGFARTPQAASQGTPPVRPIGAVTELKPGSMTLHTDAGPSLVVQLPEGVTVLRVPPGAKDLKSATKITVDDIKIGDRIIARGRASEDGKSLVASTLLVMSEADLTKARETEQREWRERGIGGLVKGIDPATKEITISVPPSRPRPGTQRIRLSSRSPRMRSCCAMRRIR